MTALAGAVAPGAATAMVLATVTLEGFLTVVVLGVTVMVGVETEPSGVYVAVPDAALLTAAVTLELVRLTLPLGVNAPVEVIALPLKVG